MKTKHLISSIVSLAILITGFSFGTMKPTFAYYPFPSQYNAVDQFDQQISALSSGGMSSPASTTQAGPWVAQYKEDGQTSWNTMNKYQYMDNEQSSYMIKSMIAYSGFSEPNLFVGYKDWNPSNPKVLQARLRLSYTTDLALSYTINDSGKYEIAPSSDITDIWVSEAPSPALMNITVKIMVNSQVKWTSPVLRNQGSSVAFPQILFDGVKGDIVKIIIERLPDVDAPDSFAMLALKPVLKFLSPDYSVVDQFDRQISALSNGGMSSPASTTQAGPWVAQYKEDGQSSWNTMNKYQYINNEQSSYMTKSMIAYGGFNEPNLFVGYKDWNPSNPKVLQARFRLSYSTDLALSYTINDSGKYEIASSSDITDIWVSEAPTPALMNITVKIMVNSQVKWTSPVLRNQGSSVAFPQIFFDGVKGDIVKIIIERLPDAGAADSFAMLALKPVIKMTSPTYDMTEQFTKEISSLSSGGMTSVSSLKQAGPWVAQFKEEGLSVWNTMNKYKFENSTDSSWMRMAYVAFGGTSEPIINVNYKDYDIINPKVVTALLRSDYTVDLSLSTNIESNGLYRLYAPENVPNIWVSEATDPRMDVVVKILVNNSVKWTSSVLRTQGSSIAFPQIDFTASQGDSVRILIDKTSDSGAPASITQLSFKPILKLIPASFGNFKISNSNVITNVTPNNTKAQHMQGIVLDNNVSLVVKNFQNVTLGDSDIIGTGATIEVNSYDSNSIYKVVIYGDVNGDGIISLLDLASTKLHILKTLQLQDVFLSAGDTSKNGKISISDLLAIKKQILNISTIPQL